MPQWKKSRLLTAVVAAGLVAGMIVATPSALADPDAPDPGVAAGPIDPGLPVEAPLPPPMPPAGDPVPPPAPGTGVIASAPSFARFAGCFHHASGARI